MYDPYRGSSGAGSIEPRYGDKLAKGTLLFRGRHGTNIYIYGKLLNYPPQVSYLLSYPSLTQYIPNVIS
jgi:hypothetical protein